MKDKSLIPKESIFEKCNRQAQKKLDAKVPESWHQNVWVWGNPLQKPPTSYAIDWEDNDGGMLRYLVHRMFRETYHQWLWQTHRVQLDDDIIETVRQIAMEARRESRSVIRAVAEYFDLTLDKARQWLALVDVDAFGTLEAGHLASETPSELVQVEARPTIFLVSVCAGKGILKGWRDTAWETTLEQPPTSAHKGCLGSAFATYNLCKHCFDYYGGRRSTYPKWLLHLIRSNEREAYHNEKAYLALVEEVA